MNMMSGSDTKAFQRSVRILIGRHIISQPLFAWRSSFYRGQLRIGLRSEPDFVPYLSALR
jgi:hypothetical protein